MNCGGTGLVGYSDSSEEESGGGEGKEEDGRSPPRKKQHRSGKSPGVAMATPQTTLPLPMAILEMFNEEDSPGDTKEDVHEGRVRAFPHVRGNWATFVFVPIRLSGELQTCITALHNYLQTTFAPCVGSPQFHMMPLSDSHVSLSRTVAIQHHWIDPLTEVLRDKFRRREGFTISFSELAFYCNDEKTRSFLGLEVSLGHVQLCSLVEDVDECFAKYSLQEFYKEPSFHMSVFWCLENILPKIREERRLLLQDHWQSLLLEHNLLTGSGSAECYEVTDVRCKTGNKVFSFPLTV